MIVVYALPHLALAVLTNSRVQGRYRHSWWAEVYETVLATFIILPTTLALINPKLGKFNVTAKGGIVDRDYFDGDIAKPYFVLYLLNIIGIGIGIGCVRLYFADLEMTNTVWLNMAWATYNLIILGAALSVASERRQLRRTVRVEDELKAAVRKPGTRKIVQTLTFDVSTGGLALRPNAELGELAFAVGDPIEVSLESPGRRLWLPGTVRKADQELLTLEFEKLNVAQESSLTQSLFGRADAWMDWRDREVRDRPLKAMGMIFTISLAGSYKFWRWAGRQSLAAIGIRRGASSGAAAIFAAVLLAGLGSGGQVQAQTTAPAATPVDARVAGQLPSNTTGPAAKPVADPFSITARALPKSDTAFSETTRTLTFAELGVGFPMRLSTVFAQASVSLPLRRDQVVTAAKLRLKYAHSPSLVGRFSSLTALVNDEVVDTFLLDPSTAARGERVIDINPALFLEFNQIRFDGVMHYVDVERECEDPTHSSLWSLISNQSTLELTLAALPQPPNLTRLPRPFFEPNDPRRLRLPIAFAARPGTGAMTAAAITASWFGALADYRGAEFPVSYGNVLPRGHALVLRSGKDFESQLGPVPNGVQLRVVTHPDDPSARLLVLEASDDAGLIRAAQALTLGMASLDGSEVAIHELALPPEPPRGTAPRWIDPALPVQLGKLASGPTSVLGLTPGPINYNFRLPPDISFNDAAGAEVDVRYRYAPITAPGATLSTLLNDAFVASTILARAGGGGAATGDARIEPDRARISIPAGRLASNNRLSFQYQFRRIAAKPCESFQADALGGSVDPDSVIKFGPHDRYARWPDLGRFRDAGMPFSLQSDFGETVMLVPDAADEDALSAALLVAGHFGQVTGSPALRILVDTVGNGESHADREVLLIGRQTQLNMPESWLATLPLVMTADSVTLKPISAIDSLQAWVTGRDIEGARSYAGRELTGSSGELGLIIGGRSPFSSSSAVWLAAGSKVSLLSVAEALIDPARRQFIEGDVSLLRSGQVSGYLLSDQWGIGHLPWYRQFRDWLAARPWLMTPLALFFAVLATLLIYGSLSRRAARRLKAGGG